MRTIAYNVYECTGYPEDAVEETWRSGGESEGEDGVVDRMIAALDSEAPDLLTFTEAPPVAVVEAVAAGLGMEARVFPSRGDWPGALFSDLPIREAATVPDLLGQPPADLFTRHAGRAVLGADDREIVVYSVHLHPEAEATRLREVESLRDPLEADVRSDRPVLLQGDLNHRPDGPEYGAWADVGLTDACAVGDASAEPTFPADDPEKRIDYMWGSERASERLTAARTLSERPFGRGSDPASPGDPFLSDHLPVAAEFESLL